uniref:Uncharacterized protein n=1 Tax=Wuchereria bancrofti TaxID=6293 RepID=A0AAF5PK29_WUCBA
MHYWVVAFMLALQMVDVTSRTSMISGKLSQKTDEQKMQIFLNELKICKQKGDKMEAFVTDNRSLTIIQNHSLHLPSNLTKSIKEFNIVLKNIIVPNNECMGMVLDASLNYINVNILLLCYEKNRTIDWNNSGKNNSEIDDQIISFLNYVHRLLHLFRPSYLSQRNRSGDKIDSIRYHFIPNETEQQQKTREKNKKFWEKTVVLLILIVAFICFLIASIKGIQWLCGKKKPICNIPDEERLLILSNNGILPMETGNDFCYVNKPYHARSKKVYHSISHF